MTGDQYAIPPPYRPGDREDFARLYQASYPSLVRTLFAVVGGQAAAEDCAQESFVRAFKAWSRWRPEAPAEAWLHRIAINVAISYRRRERLREVGEVVRRLGRPKDGDDPGVAAERGDLMKALLRIRPEDAAVIVLRHYHGYNNREMAVALGVSERTVGGRLARAASELRGLLGADWGELPTSAPPAVDVVEEGESEGV